MKDPAVLFYTQDFLVGTITMTNEHKGMYITLLCLQHQKGNLTEKDMLSICFSYVPEVYAKFEKAEDGTYYNLRMKEEAERRAAFSASRRKNASKNGGKRGANNKQKNGKAYAKHMDNHMENEHENENIGLSIEKKGGEKSSTQAPPPISVPGETASEMSHRIVTEWQEKKGKGLTYDSIVIQAAFLYKNISEHTGYREPIYATDMVEALKKLNEPDVNSLNTICKWALKHSFWSGVVATTSSFCKNYPKIKLQYNLHKSKKSPQFAD